MNTQINPNGCEITLISDEDLDAVAGGGVSMSYSSIQFVYKEQHADQAPPPPPTR